MKTGILSLAGRLFRTTTALCTLSFLVCFFLALLLFMPLEPFAQRLEQLAKKQGVTLSIQSPGLRFPLGLAAQTMEVGHVQLLHPPFQLSEVSLRPRWLSLASSNPGLSFDLQTLQGQVSGSAYRNGRVTASFDKLQISEPLGTQLPLTLIGTLDKAEFDGMLPLAGKNRSSLKIDMSDLRIEGLQKLGSSSDLLPLGRLNCSAEANGPLVQINSLTSTGPAFDLKGNGSLRLGRTPANSSLNLNLVLTPKAGLDPLLNDLLSLTRKPEADGSYQLSLRGSLTNLRIN